MKMSHEEKVSKQTKLSTLVKKLLQQKDLGIV
jgi:hypothetical protein